MDGYQRAGGNSPRPRLAGKQFRNLIVNDPSKVSQFLEHTAEVTHKLLQRGWITRLQI